MFLIMRGVAVLTLFSWHLLAHTPTNSTKLMTLQDLAGKWYIVKTNFPMWLKGDKTQPTFNYTVVERKGKEVLLDEVKYIKNNKNKSIVGYDYPLDSDNSKFVWRGKGILGLLKSKWRVVYIDHSKQWAIIEFEKTLFTPAGYDVIVRNKNINDDVINQKLKELNIPTLTAI